MRILKIALPVVMVILLALSWISTAKDFTHSLKEYNDCIVSAETSIEDGLYDQAVEFYKESMKYKTDKSIYYKIKDVHEKHYNEEHTELVRNNYIKDMDEAANKYPKEATFWCSIANLYIEAQNYSSAYKSVKKGKKLGANSEELDALYNTLTYMTKVESKVYYGFSTALNGYISLFNGEYWKAIDEKGKQISEENVYSYIGTLNDNGTGMYVNDKETRLIDKKGIARARFSFKATETGCYDEKSGLIPVKINDKWQYVKDSGELDSNKYEFAGSFFSDKAAVYDGKKWFIINQNFETVSDKEFEDIKLDLYGNCVQGEIIIAKENGKYHLYDTNISQKNDFECDDIDICINNSPIAFKNNDKWGFIKPDGKIVIEPTYKSAKSFSENYAAISNGDGKWGYINDDNELVIKYEYKDAFYFSSGNKSFVSVTEDSYQVLRFLLQ